MTGLAMCIGVIAAAVTLPLADGPPPSGYRACPEPRQVAIQVFYLPGCRDCSTVKERIMPVIDRAFPDRVTVDYLSITDPAHAARLVYWQDAFDTWTSDAVYVLVPGQVLLAGIHAIRDGLMPAIAATLGECLPGEPGLSGIETPVPGGYAQRAMEPQQDDLAGILARRLAGIRVGAVVMAGLVDSLNPCAISTLIFLLSALAVARIGGKRLVWTGCGFIAGCFVAYTALGLGLLHALHAVTYWTAPRVLLDAVVLLLLIMLAGFSFLDALNYRKSGQPATMWLKLPDRLKARIRTVIHRSIRSRRMFVSAGIMGSTVAILESVCTGQVYVPTLMLIIRTGTGRAEALGLLLLYNVMFVMPLIIVFAVAAKGFDLPVWINWSRRHTVAAKLALAACFLGLAVLFAAFRTR